MIKTKHDLFTQMLHGATIITPNNRLSNQLLQDFYRQQGSVVEEKPHCLPYQALLRNLFNKARHQYPHALHPLLLNSLQLRYLWKDILSNQDAYPCNDGLLHEIQDAWTRCQHWEIDPCHASFLQTPQTRQFQQWQQQLLHTLTKLFAITEEQLVPQLQFFPAVLQLKTVIWVCFDDYTPQQRTLQQAFNAEGCAQYFYDLESRATPAHRYDAHDSQDERLQMIHWLKERLAAGDTRIGVVVPELQAQYSSLQRLLQRHLSRDQFNFSLGKPLADYPLVAHALTWLSLNKEKISNHHARLLLHSPYLYGAKTELTARAQTLQNNPLLQEADIPFNRFLDELNSTLPKLAHVLKNTSDYPTQDTPQGWINHFKNRLKAFGFPGEYPLNSSAYQCFQRMMGLFDELLQLSLIKPHMNAQQALTALQDLATGTIFQTRKSTTPIQISGLLEASGCEFDSVWVSGLTDLCLPQKTKLSAFIPLDMQRERLMPRAVVARELQFARQLLQRLQDGSQHCVFSYPRLTLDMPNMPSPLIISLLPLGESACKADEGVTNIEEHPHPSLCDTFPQREKGLTALVPFEDTYSLPLNPTETASGGTSLLANQAKCPFRAFAAHRLHLKPELKLSTGPDASERGQVIHRIMELLWKDIQSQQHLNTLTTENLNQRIEHAIHSALTPVIQNRALSFPPLVQTVELTRLKRLVNACFDWEKQRPTFVIDALEQTFSIQLAGLELRVRIDRLDALESGEKWVIDYKTSLPSSKPWNEDRPEAPQLLLYALLDDTINALLFVQLKAGRLTCSGLSEEDLPIKGISALKKNERWSDYQKQWHQQLTVLATEFQAGFCPPKPSRVSTCDYCEFHSLCRIA